MKDIILFVLAIAGVIAISNGSLQTHDIIEFVEIIKNFLQKSVFSLDT